MFDLEEFVGGDDGRRVGGTGAGTRMMRATSATGRVEAAHRGRLGSGRECDRRASLGFAAVGQIQSNAGHDAAVRDFSPARIFHDVDAELNDVARTNLSRRTFLRTFAQTLVIHECAVTAFRVLGFFG